MRVPGYRFLPALGILLIAAQARTANGSAPYDVSVQETLDPVRADLNGALQHTVWPTAGEAPRLERERHPGPVHAARHAPIESLNDVVERNRLTSRARMAFTTDLERLRVVRDLNKNYHYR